MATSNNSVVVSRIQNRRGLKQDLPQPLRSGEIGWSTDSRQVFIGGDESNSALNKVLIFHSKTISINEPKKDTTSSILLILCFFVRSQP